VSPYTRKHSTLIFASFEKISKLTACMLKLEPKTQKIFKKLILIDDTRIVQGKPLFKQQAGAGMSGVC